MSKEDAAAREAAEAKISTGEPPAPPDYLTDAQREIFETVCTDLKESSILCSIDNYVLANFAIAVDRLQNIERSINAMPEKMLEKSVMAAKDRYTKDFFRGCAAIDICHRGYAIRSADHPQQTRVRDIHKIPARRKSF